MARGQAERWLRGARAVLVLCAGLVLAWVEPAEARRVALVVANASYANAQVLSNPPNDAEIVAAAAQQAGFTVITAADLTKAEFDQKLREFRQEADGAEVALIYYAGHGIESGGQNYLIPIDARLGESRDLPFEAVALDLVLQNVAGARRQVIIIDACRENPFGVSWSGGREVAQRGLAQNQVPGALIIYAASQGLLAVDGEGDNSPFALAVARWLPAPGVQLQLLGGKIADDVFAATAGRQRPWTYSGMGGAEFLLVPQEGLAASPAGEDYDALKRRLERLETMLAQAAAGPRPVPAPAAAGPAAPRVRAVGAPAEGSAAGGAAAAAASRPAAPVAGGAALVLPTAPQEPAGTNAGVATLMANRSSDRVPLPAMPATPRFAMDSYPGCRDDYQGVPDPIGRVNAINACLRALTDYSANVLNAFNNRMAEHQRDISLLYKDKVGGSDDYTEASQQQFYRRMMKEFADSNPDGVHFADHRTAVERARGDRALLEQAYCTTTGRCAGGPGGSAAGH